MRNNLTWKAAVLTLMNMTFNTPTASADGLTRHWPQERRITVEDQSWRSDAFPITPLAYYRIRFDARTDGPGYWAAVFFDDLGAELPDHNDAVFPADGWLKHEFCFRGQALATQAAIQFTPQRHLIAVRHVEVVAVERHEVARWADALAAQLGPITALPDRAPVARLTHTRRKLEGKQALRVVVLGDSIANDLSNSAFDVLLERAYPGSRVALVNSVRGGTGCWYYRQSGRVNEYVLRYLPDLLIVAGISHRYNTEAIDSVLEQVRARSSCEILLLNDAMAAAGEERSDRPASSRTEMSQKAEQFDAALIEIANRHGAEFFDLRRAWSEVVERSARPSSWFLRDRLHANMRGRQVLGRLLLRFMEVPDIAPQPVVAP